MASLGRNHQPQETVPTRWVVQGPSKQPGLPAGGDSTLHAGLCAHQVVKEIAAASRDVSAEDSLYETVKELKEAPAHLSLANGTARLSPDVPPHHPAGLLNGHLSPCTPERGPLCTGAEYASIDLRKKSRHSADMESSRRSNSASVPVQAPLEEPEEDSPPPVPEKVLDENDNQPVLVNGSAGAGLHNGEVREGRAGILRSYQPAVHLYRNSQTLRNRSRIGQKSG